MSENCSVCKFWLREPTTLIARSSKDGMCRKNPPVPLLVAGPGGQPAILSSYSKTQEDMWCGEFKLKVTLN